MLILIGAFLLSLPISNTDGKWLNIVDALFTSTSAVCVTGLVVVDTAIQFTFIGKLVILLLIQIGGLGIVALTSLVFLLLGKKINLSSRLTIKESLNKESLQGCVGFIKKVLIITFSIEFVGMLLLLYPTISFTGNFWNGLFCAIFMSVSAFCNAGFDIMGAKGQEFASLYGFTGTITMLLPLMMLIVLGGIGFVVFINGRKGLKTKQHSKIVLMMTLILLFGGALIYAILEWNNPNTIGNMSFIDKVINCLFQSTTTRTAGFATIDQALLTPGSRILTMMLMFVGGSPNSCAGGIKTTTFFVFMMFLFRKSNANGDVRIKDKKISRKILNKTIKIISYALLFTIVCTIIIGIFEGNTISFESILFECVSAISTVGLTTGITTMLTEPSQIVLIVLMFVGRVGLTTITLAISARNIKENNLQIDYPNTDIVVG